MKNRIIILLCIYFLICCSACTRSQLTLSDEKIEIEVGHTYTVFAQTSDNSENIEWKMENSDIAAVKKGKITALKEGKTRLVVSAAGKEVYCDVVIVSEKVRKEIDLGTVVVETSKNCEVALSELIDKDVKEILYNDGNVLKSFDKKTGLIQIDSNIISASISTAITQGLVIYTDAEKYTLEAQFVTMVIDNEEELNQMSKMINSSDGSGCYVLGSDIHCTKEYVSGNTVNFYGTFDGRGHSIYDMRISNKNGNACGLFGSSFFGVLRNVSFINASHGGTGGFIATSTGGTIQDVYIQVNVEEKSLGAATTIIGADTHARLRVSRVLIEYINPLPAKIFGGYAVLDMHQGNESYQGMYVIGVEKVMGRVVTKGNGDIYGAYMTYDEFRAGVGNLSSWEGDFWRITDGIPVPKQLNGNM